MSIQDQIQIIEDNLNEYGQCNITLEEFNYLKDELYSAGCLAGIELGRKEAIEEYESAEIPIIHGKDELEGYRKKVRADAIDEYTKKLRKRIEGNKIIADHLAKNDKFKELALTNLDLEEIEMIAEDMMEGIRSETDI